MQKKILIVATVASHIKSFHLPYLKMMKENGYKTSVAANWNLPNDEKKFDYCDEYIQIPIQRSPYSIKNISAIKQLKEIIDREKYDIIHCHTPMGAVVARLAARNARKKYGTKVIYTAHGFHFYKGAPLKNWILFYPIEKILSKYTDVIITINKEDYSLAKNKFSNRCKNIQYVPGVGISLKKFQQKIKNEEKKELKESIGLDDNTFVLTCVARLDENKNQGFIIKSINQLVNKNNNIHLLLVGRDENNGKYQRLVKEYNLEKNIHFLGNREDVPQLLSISNIILSASKREGLPVNVIEAFASGLPVVALRCRGMEDLIENGKNGFIINNSDEFEYVSKIELLMNDLKLINEIKINNLEKAKLFEISNVLNEVKEIYDNNR